MTSRSESRAVRNMIGRPRDWLRSSRHSSNPPFQLGQGGVPVGVAGHLVAVALEGVFVVVADDGFVFNYDNMAGHDVCCFLCF